MIDAAAITAWNRANVRARLAYHDTDRPSGENPQRACTDCGKRTRHESRLCIRCRGAA